MRWTAGWKLDWCGGKGRRLGGGEKAEEKSKPTAFKTKAAAPDSGRDANSSLGEARAASLPRGGPPGTPQVSEHPERKQNQKGYKGHFRATETVSDDPARM